jgi:hypothetical protein
MAVGDFVSVYPDAATVSPYVARITTVTATTFTTDATAKAGTAPVDGTLNTSAKLGGAWKGPNAAESFPIGFISGQLCNVSSESPRVNFKNDATYNITAAMTHTGLSGGTVPRSLVFEGFTTSYGDGGRATIDGGTTGASYVLLTLAGTNADIGLRYLIFQNNGATGSASGLVANTLVFGCVVNNVRGTGFSSTGGVMVECEAYSCNQSNTTNLAGFSASASCCVRCISHDNTGSNNDGFIANSGLLVCVNCIADSNGRRGFSDAINSSSIVAVGCDAYNNGSHGMLFSESSTGKSYHLADSCNLSKNGGYGIQGSLSNISQMALVINCGFGAGTEANTSGQTNNLREYPAVASVSYASNSSPWTDPANGDFRISLAAAKGAGRGAYTQTQASYAGTIGYPDIGAAQAVASGGGMIGGGTLNGGFL